MVAAGAAAGNQTLYRRLPFDLLRDFAPVTLLGAVPNVLAVHPAVPARDAAEFAALAAERLTPGGAWRLATDWPDYAEQIEEVLALEPLLDGGRTDRWHERPLTKFERRGLAEGRVIADFCYRRV